MNRQITKGLYMETIGLQQAREMAGGYGYLIAHMISSLQYGPAKEVSVDWEELLELWAFGQKEALHVYQSSEGLWAVRLCEEGDGGDYLVKSYATRDHKVLQAKEYLAPDVDGQAVTVCTRPFAVIEEAEYGKI